MANNSVPKGGKRGTKTEGGSGGKEDGGILSVLKQAVISALGFVVSVACLVIKLVTGYDTLNELKASRITSTEGGTGNGKDEEEDKKKEETSAGVEEPKGGKEVVKLLMKDRILDAIAKNAKISKLGALLDGTDKLTNSEKVEVLLPEVISSVVPYLNVSDHLSLRLVNQSVRSSMDSRWCPKLSHLSSLSSIYLTNLQEVSQFTKQMMPLSPEETSTSDPAPIPFVVVVGGISPYDCNYQDWEESYMDQLPCEVFWRAFNLCAQKIGPRITSLILDIRIDPSFGVTFVESIVTLIITQSLHYVPNLRYLVFITNTVNVEKSLSMVYSVKDSDGNRFPKLSKLECVEMLTVSEGHPSKSKFKTRSITFPARFLRQHGTTVKGFRIYGNLYDFKSSMGVFQAPVLEWVHFDIHHCACQGKDPELKALLNLPVVDQEEDPEPVKKLKDIAVNINWQWRTSDMSSFFKWLGRNYAQHRLNKISLRNSESAWKQVHPHDGPYCEDANYFQPPQMSGTKVAIKGSSAYGSDFPWLNILQMPPIRSLEIWSEYQGSYMFLKGVRLSLEHLLVQQQHFFRNEEEMKDVFRRGLVKEIFGEEALLEGKGKSKQTIWQYFPKLKEVEVVWRSINFKNVNLNWDVDRLMPGVEYTRKEILKRMRWKLTREEGMAF